jgi:hypothetical protein
MNIIASGEVTQIISGLLVYPETVFTAGGNNVPHLSFKQTRQKPRAA